MNKDVVFFDKYESFDFEKENHQRQLENAYRAFDYALLSTEKLGDSNLNSAII